MTDIPVSRNFTHPRIYLFRMLIFIFLILFFILLIQEDLTKAFQTNPVINTVISSVLGFGIIYILWLTIRLFREVKWVNNFQNGDHHADIGAPPSLLAPMATMMLDHKYEITLSATSMRSILDSISFRLDESREYSRYMIGLLIFLGLLGTFWGLLLTVDSIGQTISTLKIGTGEASIMFEELKLGLEKPLSGMGVAFSSSLFGLSGSLILGFFDLLYNQAQNRFYNELEEWLSTVTEINDERSDSKMNFYLNRNLKDMNSILVELEKALNSESINKSSELKTVLNSIEQQNKDISKLLSEQNKIQKKIIEEVKKK
ncbi:MAG: flagellar motor protein MotA [Pseudomonadota bacterium]|nr:flagellar motor protein MotA [Pseudomonadota bacterium]